MLFITHNLMIFLQIWIFIAAGGSNTNYVHLLLEMYCLFTYESKKDLKDAIWNNWLVNVTGQLGKWIPDDLLQEHYNRWLEEIVKKSGRNFDDQFLRKVISPNVEFFLRLKEELEDSLELYRRSKSHKSRHLCGEYKQLLNLWGEEHLSLFRTKRSMGHAAMPLFDSGSEKLASGLLSTHLDRHTSRVKVLQAMGNIRNRATVSNIPSPSINSNPSPPLPSSSGPVDLETSSPSGRSNKETQRENRRSDEVDEEEEIDLMEAKNLSRLALGPELMPSIDANSGRLIYEWEDDIEELLEGEDGVDSEDKGDDDMSNESDCEPDSDVQ